MFGNRDSCHYLKISSVKLLSRVSTEKFKMSSFHITKSVPFNNKGNYMWAYLEDIAGLVPDHCNKVSIKIKQVT